ncbi:hypothetical protein Mgra_00007288 [Meloidogyne graminicola]|uniref:Uncharacterized protein n=1 Tax=Meloidogyne graminicola TaxID=189291 RepID=A0A8S9ZJ62_9BILA|nr:hypothetical protein Mgra_00007288 [Meloidogyne graminicola]
MNKKIIKRFVTSFSFTALIYYSFSFISFQNNIQVLSFFEKIIVVIVVCILSTIQRQVKIKTNVSRGENKIWTEGKSIIN